MEKNHAGALYAAVINVYWAFSFRCSVVAGLGFIDRGGQTLLIDSLGISMCWLYPSCFIARLMALFFHDHQISFVNMKLISCWSSLVSGNPMSANVKSTYLPCFEHFFKLLLICRVNSLNNFLTARRAVLGMALLLLLLLLFLLLFLFLFLLGFWDFQPLVFFWKYEWHFHDR